MYVLMNELERSQLSKLVLEFRIILIGHENQFEQGLLCETEALAISSAELLRGVSKYPIL